MFFFPRGRQCWPRRKLPRQPKRLSIFRNTSRQPFEVKRPNGNERPMKEAWELECRAYEVRAHRARTVRNFGSDLVEIYGGHAEITRVGVLCGLRVLQPVDKASGIALDPSQDFSVLRNLLLKHKPFLAVYEFPCTLWSIIQHINYDRATLEAMRKEQTLRISEMVKTIQLVHMKYGGHFLLQNPAQLTPPFGSILRFRNSMPYRA